jgi:thioredoxin-related protein
MKSVLFLSCLMAIALVAMTGPARAASDAWETNFDAASKKAAESGKELLINFSGSDWCGWCIRLDKEVFSHQEFLDGAKKDYVLVVLDFPRQEENLAKIPEAEQARNEELQQKYAIQGFPTVLLANAEGEVYARTGYRPNGPEAYLKELAAFREARDKRVAVKAKIASAEGLEKAKLLDELVESTAADMQPDLAPEMKEIVSLDGDGKAGLRDKYRLRVGMLDAAAALREQDFEKAAGQFETLLKDLNPQGEQRQQLLLAMGEPYFYLDKTDKVVELLKQAVEAAPDSDAADGIKQMIERFSATPSEE